MIIAFLVFFALNMTLYLGLYLYLLVFEGTHIDYDKLTKMEKFTWINHFYVCMGLTIMTLVILWTITSMRRDLQANFYYSHISSGIDHGLNYLKLRTIDIEVVHYDKDITSHKLVGVVKTELRKQGLNTRINAATVMPDFTRLFELEKERTDLISNFSIMAKYKPPWKIVIPNEFLVASEYKKKIDQIDFLIDQELMKPIKPSTTAFMSLDSLKSISHLKNRFR